jgi:hypothetical protein
LLENLAMAEHHESDAAIVATAAAAHVADPAPFLP